jgi:hypothetical protein
MTGLTRGGRAFRTRKILWCGIFAVEFFGSANPARPCVALIDTGAVCVNDKINADLGGTSFNGYVPAEQCLEILFPGRGLCLRTLRTLQLSGRIPHLKIGRKVLFNPVEVRAALDSLD